MPKLELTAQEKVEKRDRAIIRRDIDLLQKNFHEEMESFKRSLEDKGINAQEMIDIEAAFNAEFETYTQKSKDISHLRSKHQKFTDINQKFLDKKAELQKNIEVELQKKAEAEALQQKEREAELKNAIKAQTEDMKTHFKAEFQTFRTFLEEQGLDTKELTAIENKFIEKFVPYFKKVHKNPDTSLGVLTERNQYFTSLSQNLLKEKGELQQRVEAEILRKKEAEAELKRKAEEEAELRKQARIEQDQVSKAAFIALLPVVIEKANQLIAELKQAPNIPDDYKRNLKNLETYVRTAKKAAIEKVDVGLYSQEEPELLNRGSLAQFGGTWKDRFDALTYLNDEGLNRYKQKSLDVLKSKINQTIDEYKATLEAMNQEGISNKARNVIRLRGITEQKNLVQLWLALDTLNPQDHEINKLDFMNDAQTINFLSNILNDKNFTQEQRLSFLRLMQTHITEQKLIELLYEGDFVYRHNLNLIDKTELSFDDFLSKNNGNLIDQILLPFLDTLNLEAKPDMIKKLKMIAFLQFDNIPHDRIKEIVSNKGMVELYLQSQADLDFSLINKIFSNPDFYDAVIFLQKSGLENYINEEELLPEVIDLVNKFDRNNVRLTQSMMLDLTTNEALRRSLIEADKNKLGLFSELKIQGEPLHFIEKFLFNPDYYEVVVLLVNRNLPHYIKANDLQPEVINAIHILEMNGQVLTEELMLDLTRSNPKREFLIEFHAFNLAYPNLEYPIQVKGIASLDNKSIISLHGILRAVDELIADPRTSTNKNLYEGLLQFRHDAVKVFISKSIPSKQRGAKLCDLILKQRDATPNAPSKGIWSSLLARIKSWFAPRRHSQFYQSELQERLVKKLKKTAPEGEFDENLEEGQKPHA